MKPEIQEDFLKRIEDILNIALTVNQELQILGALQAALDSENENKLNQ